MEVERELVEAAQAGDREALAELIRVTHRGVYTQALRLLGNPEDAADVTQDVYLRVVRKLGGFRHEASFTTWLSRVTTNVAMSTLSRRSRRLAVEGGVTPEDLADPAADPADRSELIALAAKLEGLVHALPAGQRQVLVLRDVYGLSTDEVAAQLKISETATKVRIHRARKMLKDAMYGARTDET